MTALRNRFISCRKPLKQIYSAVRVKPNRWHVQLTGAGSDPSKRERPVMSSASGIWTEELVVDLPPPGLNALANKLTRRSFFRARAQQFPHNKHQGRPLLARLHFQSDIRHPTLLNWDCRAELAFYIVYTRKGTLGICWKTWCPTCNFHQCSYKYIALLEFISVLLR